MTIVVRDGFKSTLLFILRIGKEAKEDFSVVDVGEDFTKEPTLCRLYLDVGRLGNTSLIGFFNFYLTI